jgi:hypothetical protein
MFRPTFLNSVFVTLAVLRPRTVNAYAESNPLVSCTGITMAEDGESFNVCSPLYFTTPVPMYIENATGEFSEYGGGWDHYFTIYNSSAEGNEEGFEGFPVEASANMTVHVRREDNNACSVNVKEADGTKSICASCSYCGDPNQPTADQMSCMTCGTYSADCTNLEHGRMVECESIATAFFPFTKDAMMQQQQPGSNKVRLRHPMLGRRMRMGMGMMGGRRDRRL